MRKPDAPDYRLLATDLDGTLLRDDKTISERSLRVLLEAQQCGLHLILSTGRPLDGVLRHAATLRLNEYGGYIIACNGSVLYDCASGCILEDRTVSPVFFPYLQKVAAEGFCLVSYKHGRIATEHPESPYAQYLSRINRMPLLRLRDFAEEIDFPEPKCIIAGSPRRLWHLERKLRQALEGFLAVYRSESFLLEIVPLGVDKAAALDRLLSLLHLTNDQLICCGDGYNDLSMLQLAGLSVAMSNAKEPLRQAADLIAPSNNEDGVAWVVEKYFT